MLVSRLGFFPAFMSSCGFGFMHESAHDFFSLFWRVVHMDIFLLRTFQQQVELQCKFMLTAAQELNKALAGHNAEHIFYALQNLLNASANISKALWGPKGNRNLARQRKPLRDSIGIRDDSPLREVTMRNNFEHFDERLDKWWAKSKRHNKADLAVGPPNMFQGFEDIDRFRMFDPVTTNMTFWSQEFNIQAIINEVTRVFPTLQREASKPHWDPATLKFPAAATGNPPDEAKAGHPGHSAPSD